MWSPATLRRINQEAHDKAVKAGKQPKVLTPNAIEKSPPFKIPNLDGYCPKGWHELERWRAAKTDMDSRSLSPAQIKEVMQTWVEQYGHKNLGWAICEEGQFQLYFAAYLKLKQVNGHFWYGYTDDKLVIQVSDEKKEEIDEQYMADIAEFQEQATLRGILLPLVVNSELVWVEKEDTPDLYQGAGVLDALGILGEGMDDAPISLLGCKTIDGLFHPIEKRWVYVALRMSSAQDDLLNDGEVVFEAIR